MKKEVITAFISRYHVTPQQAAVLKRSDQMDPEFFTVLDRVKSIHQDCKILLQTHQTTGLQIMENMAHLQEQAFQTLFKWTQVLIILFNSDPTNHILCSVTIEDIVAIRKLEAQFQTNNYNC